MLHKHTDRFQSFELSFGQAHVYYPEVSADRCSACLLLDVDAVGMVRGKNPDQNFLLAQYVNDRPYVASSFLSVAIAQVYGSALQGRCKDRPELVNTPIPLTANLDVLSVRGGERVLRAMFEPLGYDVEVIRYPLDERYPDWGDSPYFSVTVRKTTTLSDLLTHLYVLVPVFDARKHYYVGEEEIQNLLRKGEGWLAQHPEKEEIVRRYLRYQQSLYRSAIYQLLRDEGGAMKEEGNDESTDSPAVAVTPRLNDERLMAVLAALKTSGAMRVLDLGCGEGKLLRRLMKDKQFTEIVGLDVSVRCLEIASARLKLEQLSESQASRIKLIHGSLMYRDKRLEGYDAASVVEVIEHLDPPRLKAFERVLFEFAKPRTIVLTTPNAEYNAVWETLPAGEFRHADHRFEWTRQEFQTWANAIATRFGYAVRFQGIGPEHATHGTPTQMGIFESIA